METKQSDKTKTKQRKNKRLVVLDIFEKGKRFTEELIIENENLRKKIMRLIVTNRDLNTKLEESNSQTLTKKIEALESANNKLQEENRQLKDQFIYVEDENREFAERYVEVERQNSDLINLYVASHRLHSSLNYDDVLQIVKEIVINMIGSEQFAIFMRNSESDKLEFVTAEDLTDEELHRIQHEGLMLEECAQCGDVLCISEEEAEKNGSPIACIPMKVDDKVLGVIAIYSLLIQKSGFEALDYEMFELLGCHSATAIYSAKMFTALTRKNDTLQGFLNLLKGNPIDEIQAQG